MPSLRKKAVIFAVDPRTTERKFIAKGTYPNSLSFVPQGTISLSTMATKPIYYSGAMVGFWGAGSSTTAPM